MIFRRETALALTVLALVLAGCRQNAVESAPVDTAQGRADVALALAPGDPDPWVAKARLALRSGAHLDALEAVDRALALGPDHAPALFLRALMVRDAHGFAAAGEWFRSAIAADPENPDIWAEYAATLGDGGEAGAMLAAVRKLAEIAPGDPRVPYLQAVLAARGGEYPTARSLLTRSGLAARGVPAAMQLDAVISLAQGNADSAAAVFEVMVARQPANARLRELLARAMIEGGRPKEVIARFGAEAAYPETSAYMLMLLARAHEQTGDRERAAPLLARALGGAGNQLAVLTAREGLPAPTDAARRASEAGNWAMARSEVQALQRRLPASADVAALAGDVMLGAGDPQAALAAYTRAARIKRPWPLTRKAARAYAATGNRAAADTLIARHVAGDPGNGAAVIALAERLAQRGDWGRTVMLLDHAVLLGAGHDPALIGLRLLAARGLDNDREARRYAALLAGIRPRGLAER